MKNIFFTKMAGAGNDFVVIDAQSGLNYRKLAVQMCDRTNGVGADGLLILDKSKKADYRMRIINADGSEAEMCGNGVRCLASYIVKNRKPKKKLFSIETLAGLILAEAQGEVSHVRLSDPKDYEQDIPLTIQRRAIHVQSINTGVPHAIVFVDQLSNIDVGKIGPLIRYHRRFNPKGTNVNFVEQIREGLVAARTYERGVEDETKACGTGSVASAIVGFLKAHPRVANKEKAKMKVRTQGGEILEVTFDLHNHRVTNVWLKGSAKFIAQGHFFNS